jgi:hypothetical protein
MQYLLVENRQIVHLGPMNWNARRFQSEINEIADQEDLEINYTFSPTESQSYIKISDTVELFPVDAINVPDHDPLFDQLVGPFWNYDGDTATGSYNVVPADINLSKGALKQVTANQRWIKENTPFKTTVQDVEVTVDASRDNRNIFVQKYQTMADGETVDWKFPETWLTLTKAELGAIVSEGAAHIQTQFAWEKGLVDQIDAATSHDELKGLVSQIVPPQINNPINI